VKRIAWIGVVLIVLGLAGFLVPRIVYSSEETVIDAGPIEVEAEERNAIRIPDIAAGAAVVAGVVLVVAGSGKGR
jgi:hypothetical protein